MILAIDQGTTGSTCIVFDERGRPRGRSYSEFRAALPEAGLGGARRLRDLGGDPPGGDRRAGGRRGKASGPDGNRDHQPARDGRGLGSGHRRAGPPRPGLAGPPHGGALRRAPRAGPRGADPGANRARDRPLLLRHEDRVADPERGVARWRRVRHDRLLARLQAHGPSPDRLLERLADDALRHSRARLGRGALRVARGRSEILAGAGALVGGLRHHLRLRRRGARRRHRR